MLLPVSILLFSLTIRVNAGGTAALVPDSCTDDNGKYLETAVNCEDVFPLFCGPTHYYKVDATYLAAVTGGDAKISRITTCYSKDDIATATGAITVDKDFVSAATLTCPKTCGFCCKTPKYNCQNADDPAINCDKVTQAQCKDSKWRDTIAVNCPNKCGFCLDGGCVDAAIDCDKDPLVCKKTEMATFAKANCKRTCGFCATNSTSPGTGTGTCGDSHPNCVNWVRNGFCNSNGYTTVQKKQYCGKSCGLC